MSRRLQALSAQEKDGWSIKGITRPLHLGPLFFKFTFDEERRSFVCHFYTLIHRHVKRAEWAKNLEEAEEYHHQLFIQSLENVIELETSIRSNLKKLI